MPPRKAKQKKKKKDDETTPQSVRGRSAQRQQKVKGERQKVITEKRQKPKSKEVKNVTFEEDLRALDDQPEPTYSELDELPGILDYESDLDLQEVEAPVTETVSESVPQNAIDLQKETEKLLYKSFSHNFTPKEWENITSSMGKSDLMNAVRAYEKDKSVVARVREGFASQAHMETSKNLKRKGVDDAGESNKRNISEQKQYEHANLKAKLRQTEKEQQEQKRAEEIKEEHAQKEAEITAAAERQQAEQERIQRDHEKAQEEARAQLKRLQELQAQQKAKEEKEAKQQKEADKARRLEELAKKLQEEVTTPQTEEKTTTETFKEAAKAGLSGAAQGFAGGAYTAATQQNVRQQDVRQGQEILEENAQNESQGLKAGGKKDYPGRKPQSGPRPDSEPRAPAPQAQPGRPRRAPAPHAEPGRPRRAPPPQAQPGRDPRPAAAPQAQPPPPPVAPPPHPRAAPVPEVPSQPPSHAVARQPGQPNIDLAEAPRQQEQEMKFAREAMFGGVVGIGTAGLAGLGKRLYDLLSGTKEKQPGPKIPPGAKYPDPTDHTNRNKKKAKIEEQSLTKGNQQDIAKPTKENGKPKQKPLTNEDIINTVPNDAPSSVNTNPYSVNAGYVPKYSWSAPEEKLKEINLQAVPQRSDVMPGQATVDTTTASLRPKYGLLGPLDVIPSPFEQLRSDIQFDMFSWVQPGFGEGRDNKLFKFSQYNESDVQGTGKQFLPREDLGRINYQHAMPWQWQPVHDVNQSFALLRKEEDKAPEIVRLTRTLGEGASGVLGYDRPEVSNSVSSQGLNRDKRCLFEPTIQNSDPMHPVVDPPGYKLQSRGFRRLFSPWREPQFPERQSMSTGPHLNKRRSLEVILQ
jgi:hypothetical protein